ncbi:MAG: 30S ribosomal protein S4e [Euryarchaeota archaeon]|jgi:small subunit ribosomal protein S4e|nr:30S ribosomal protein S4e [Euryarchaeota archaeon]
MSAHHKKRLAMPRSWAQPRKTSVWISKPDPCGHPIDLCMSLTVVVRDELGLAHSKREVKRMLATRKLLVDGKVPKSVDRGVGLMDVLTIGDEHFRCVLDQNGKLRYPSISASDAKSKVCRIDGKNTVKGGVTQYNLHDGRNLVVKDANAYKTGDSLTIQLPDQRVINHIPFGDGVNAYLIGGSHVGSVSVIDSLAVKRSSMENEVSFSDFGTVERNVFVIGDTKLPEVDE